MIEQTKQHLPKVFTGMFVIVVLFVFVSMVFGEEKQETSSRAAGDGTPPIMTTGYYFGEVIFLDDRGISFVLLPPKKDLPRKRFYLDRYTRCQLINSEAQCDAIKIGDKIAVRYFAENDIAIADDVREVELQGEFDLDVFRKSFRKKKNSE